MATTKRSTYEFLFKNTQIKPGVFFEKKCAELFAARMALGLPSGKTCYIERDSELPRSESADDGGLVHGSSHASAAAAVTEPAVVRRGRAGSCGKRRCRLPWSWPSSSAVAVAVTDPAVAVVAAVAVAAILRRGRSRRREQSRRRPAVHGPRRATSVAARDGGPSPRLSGPRPDRRRPRFLSGHSRECVESARMVTKGRHRGREKSDGRQDLRSTFGTSPFRGQAGHTRTEVFRLGGESSDSPSRVRWRTGRRCRLARNGRTGVRRPGEKRRTRDL